MANTRSGHSADDYDFQPLVDEFFSTTGGFSRISVSLVKELLFGIYIEADDNARKSDFALSEDLGITPNSVKLLRRRYHQTHPNTEEDPMRVLFLRPTKYDAPKREMRVQMEDLYEADRVKDALASGTRSPYIQTSANGELLKLPIADYFEVLGGLCEKDQPFKTQVEPMLERLVEANPELKDWAKSYKTDTGLAWLRNPQAITALFNMGAAASRLLENITDQLPLLPS